MLQGTLGWIQEACNADKEDNAYRNNFTVEYAQESYQKYYGAGKRDK